MQISKVALVLSALSAVSARVIVAVNDDPGINEHMSEDEQIGKKNDNANIGLASPEYFVGNATPLVTTDFKDQGGPKLTAPKLYAIFYGNEWTTANTAVHQSFMKGIGAHSWMEPSRIMGGGVISYTPGVTMKIVGGVPGSTTELDTQTKIANVVIAQVGTWSEAPSDQNSYALIVDDVKSMYMKHSPTSGFLNGWCGYHSYFTKNSVKYTYSVNGWAATGTTGCRWGTLNFPDAVPRSAANGDYKDYSINVIAHELAEIITDPWISSNPGWMDLNKTTNASENGDKCNAKRGGITTNGNTYWNVRMTQTDGSFHYFTIQTIYTLASANCPQQVWI